MSALADAVLGGLRDAAVGLLSSAIVVLCSGQFVMMALFVHHMAKSLVWFK